MDCRVKPGNDRTLLHAQRDEAQFTLAVRDQQQHRLLAVLLELIDALLDVGRVSDRFLRHLDDDVAGGEPLFGGVGVAIDTGDDHALDAVLDLVLRAQVLAQRGEIEAERLLRHRLFGGVFLGLGGDLLHLFGILEAAERDLAAFLLALADDDHVDFLADRRVGDDARQILRVLDLLAVELDDDVAGLDAGGLGRPPVVDAGNQRAAGRLDVEAFGDLVGDLLDPHAEPAAAQFAELPELIDHAGHRLRRHREAEADRTAGRRDDQRVDADHLAFEVEQRSTGIAAVDGGVGLDVVVVRALADVAVARRYDTGRDRAAEAEGVADRDYPFAEPQLVGIAELHRDQRLHRLELQDRNVGLLVDPDQLGLDLCAVVHDHVDFVGIRDDVIVGDDDARFIDDEAGAERIGFARRLHLAVLVAALRRTAAAVLEEVVEELLKRRARRQLRHRVPAAAAALGLHGLRGRDIDDGIDHLLGNVGDAVRPARAGRHRRQQAGGTARDRNPHQAQAAAQGGSGTGHVGLSPKGGIRVHSAPERVRRASICA